MHALAEWLTPAMLVVLAGAVWRALDKLGAKFDRLDGKVDTFAHQLLSVAQDAAVAKDRTEHRHVSTPAE